MLPPIGRQDEIAAVQAGLRAGAVVVCGPAGLGKTTILEVVASSWAGPVVRASGGREALRRALGLGADDALERALDARPGALVVLDDATEDPRLGDRPALLASRAPLAGVAAVGLGPLREDDAVELYLAAARRIAPTIRPDMDAVRALCTALGGHPLALGVAGSRIRTLPPDTPGLLARLARERPVALALTEVVGALPAEHREALIGATAFEGSFEIDAFQEVTGGTVEALEALLDAGLVVSEGVGARVPALVREHVPRPAPERHARYVAEEGRRRFDAWRRTGSPDGIEALRADLDVVARGPTASALDAALTLAQLRIRRGPARDPLAGRHIPADRATRVTLLRARFLRQTFQHDAALASLDGLAVPEDPVLALLLTMERVHHLSALQRFDDADALVPALRTPTGSSEHDAEAALAEAILHQRRRRGPEAVAALRRGAALAESTGSVELRARMLAHLGAMLRTEDPAAGRRFLALALDAYIGFGDERWSGITSQWAGLAAADVGELPAAVALLTRSTAHCARAGALSYEANAWLYLCGVQLEAGDLVAARSALLAAERLPTTSATTRASIRAHHGLLAHRDGDLGAASVHYTAAIEALDRLARPDAVATWRAFLVLACAEAGSDTRRALEALRVGVASLGEGDRWLLRLVEAALEPGLSAEDRAGVAALGRSDLRLLVLLADRGGVTCAADGTGVVQRDGTRVSLASRPVLVRLLAALARAGPGVALTRDDLLSAGWPGQRLVGASGQARLHVAISTLRKHGVPLVTRQGEDTLSYALEGTVRVV